MDEQTAPGNVYPPFFTEEQIAELEAIKNRDEIKLACQKAKPNPAFEINIAEHIQEALEKTS